MIRYTEDHVIEMKGDLDMVTGTEIIYEVIAIIQHWLRFLHYLMHEVIKYEEQNWIQNYFIKHYTPHNTWINLKITYGII